MTSILLTGGAGYIGSHTAKALAANGYRPVVLDNFSTGNRWAVKWGPLVEGDIRNRDLVVNTIEEYGISAAVHFAARAYVGESIVIPQDYFDNNVAGSLVLLKGLLDSGVRNIVFSSTCAVYGNQMTHSISEDHPQVPVNPYGESKLFIERALRWYDQSYGLRAVCLRYFNAAGADSDLEIGEHHDPETHLIPLALTAAMCPGRCLDVYGADHPTPDGSAIRDYIHVADLAQAHVLALEYLLDGGKSESLNLGTDRGHSVKEVIAMVRKVSDSPLNVRFLHRRAGDPAALVADSSRARSILSWKPAFSDLETIVRSAWRWHSCTSFRDVIAT
jgi:UDP-arabinose 4-epimerase